MRTGTPLQVKKRDLEFSFWPVTRGQRRYGLQHTVFAASPWAVLQGAINARCPAPRRPEAMAFLAQAQDFYVAAQAGSVSTNPLLLYYAFMNLAKALILTKGQVPSLVDARHGLVEQRRQATSELAGADVCVIDDPNQQNVFPLFLRSMGYSVPANGTRIPVLSLFAEVVVGHRLWRQAGGSERFVSVGPALAHDPALQTVWALLFADRGDLTRFNITHKEVVNYGLGGQFREVASPLQGFLCFEETTPLHYGSRPSDQIAQVVERLRPSLWRIVTSVPPYRNYFVCVSSSRSELPQIGTLYALVFYFGSVTRYRPHIFTEIMASPYGAFVSEFIGAQPEQLLFLLASEFCEREVVKPAII